MRTSIPLSAVASLVAFGGEAFGGDFIEEKLELGSWVVPVHDVGEFPTLTIEIDVVGNNQPVVGFQFDMDFVNVFHDSSWASDLEFKITTPDGGTFIVGQEEFNGGDPFGPQDDIWDFDGPKSDPTGHYTSDHFPSAWTGGIEKGGRWTFMLADTWDGGVEYNNMSVTLLKIPSPAPLALIGLWGLATRRRRRTS